MEPQEEFLSPRTPPARNIGDDDVERLDENEPHADDSLSNSAGKSRRRHRRAKGRKRKQKSSLMITNDDGSEFNGSLPTKQSKIALRPTNPLLNAPRNSTQFIIDDHENSNLFWNFEVQRPLDLGEGVGHDHDPAGVYPGQYLGAPENERYSPDDECFWEAYSERDFEEVYETAHQEDVNSWDKERIVREIAAMEKRQKQLIDMLATIDPIVYLEKLQGELLSLQEVNRELKLVNIAEKLHRQERLERGERDESSDSDSRLPDSTSQEGERVRRRRMDSEDKGGCSSGCCLKDSCDESCELDQELSEEDDVEEMGEVEAEDEDSSSQDNIQINGDLLPVAQPDVQDKEAVNGDTQTAGGVSTTPLINKENVDKSGISEGEKLANKGNECSDDTHKREDDGSNVRDSTNDESMEAEGKPSGACIKSDDTLKDDSTISSVLEDVVKEASESDIKAVEGGTKGANDTKELSDCTQEVKQKGKEENSESNTSEVKEKVLDNIKESSESGSSKE